MNRYIRWFQEVDAQEVGLVGGKGANLGEMARARFPVPPGFCITTTAYRQLLAEGKLNRQINEIIFATNMDDPVDVSDKSVLIRELICRQPIPAAIEAEIIAGYRQLIAESGTPGESSIPVAIRSSATAEDLPSASFAGQQDTYLNIRGEQALLEHVRRCWASLWSARAVSYRHKQEFDHAKVFVSVVVQAMINAEIAGILFTVNPINGRADEMVVNASWGLGEAIVSGMVSPDTLTIRKECGTVLKRQTADKDQMIVYADQAGTVVLPVDAEKRLAPTLTNDQVAELAALGVAIEAHYSSPQDIEWGFAGGKWYLLQTRPITTLQQAEGLQQAEEAIDVAGVYSRVMLAEIFPDALSPSFLSVVVPLFAQMFAFTFRTLGFPPPTDIEPVRVFYHQPYFNKGYIEKALSSLPDGAREGLVEQFINPISHDKEHKDREISTAYLGMLSRMLVFLLRFPKKLQQAITQYQGEIKEINKWPVESATDQEIVDHIRYLVFDAVGRLLNYDFLLIAMTGRIYQLLESLLAPHYGEETELVVAKLNSGLPGNVTMETNMQIWDLAQEAKKSAVITKILRTQNPSTIRGILKEGSEYQDFSQLVEHFLDEYGHREIRLDIIYPTWGEDPTPVFGFLSSYLDSDEEQSPYHQQDRLQQEREQLTREVFARIEENKKGKLIRRALFRWLLGQAQIHTRERDTMHFEWTRLFTPARRMLNELGRRWAALGYLDGAEDIYYMKFEEMEEMVRQPFVFGDEAEKRTKSFAASCARSWPDIIDNGREIYLESEKVGQLSDSQFSGVAGSPGVVTGTARIIAGPEEFQNLQKGEILVAPLTNPVWTPLFAIAGGLITEVGGILSHGAIVAREYGIPAVMAVPRATQHIKDGHQVRVDGNLGVIEILHEAA